jgi:hypothetical protein
MLGFCENVIGLSAIGYRLSAVSSRLTSNRCGFPGQPAGGVYVYRKMSRFLHQPPTSLKAPRRIVSQAEEYLLFKYTQTSFLKAKADRRQPIAESR